VLFLCGGKNRFFSANANIFFTENIDLLEMFMFCGGKGGEIKN